MADAASGSGIKGGGGDRPFRIATISALGAGLFLVLGPAGIAAAWPGAMGPYFASAAIFPALYFIAMRILTFSWSLAALAAGSLSLVLAAALGVVFAAGPVPAGIALALGAAAVAASFALALETGGTAAEICRSAQSAAAARQAARRHLRPAAAATIAVSASFALLAPPDEAVIYRVIGAAAAGILAFAAVYYFVVPAGAAAIGYGEALVTRANRARERRDEVLIRIAGVASRRWAYSISGIAAVLSVLMVSDGGQFDAVSGGTALVLQLWREAGAGLGLAAAMAGAMGAAGSGDWRAFFPCAIAPFLGGTAAAWAGAHLGLAPVALLAQVMVLAAGTGTAAAILVLAAITAYRRLGDEMETAYARALSDTGPALIAAGLALSLAAAGLGLVAGATRAVAIAALAQFAAVLVLTPAFAAVIAHLFPKRRSLEEMYRAG